MYAALVFTATMLATLIAQASEGQPSAFEDMGHMLFGGIAVAICSAVVIAFIMIKLQSRKKSSSDFISIAAADNRGSK
jgi:uncharacterized protein involved in exopolysaccharide biosynthesis